VDRTKSTAFTTSASLATSLCSPSWWPLNGSDAIAIVVPKKIVPETLRFLGRRIYASLVVVLITTMIHGLSKDEAAGSGKHRKSTRARIRRSYKVPPFAF